MSIDSCRHSIFGASKVAADIMVQKYGRHFGMKTAIFRCDCTTGPAHAGVELHGFLAYLINCIVSKKSYSIFGYKGKQVGDKIHSHDLVAAFYQFIQKPRIEEIYNMGGSRYSNCSIVEAMTLCEQVSGSKLQWEYPEENRSGDHICWISDVTRFQEHYPSWKYRFDLLATLGELYIAAVSRL